MMTDGYSSAAGGAGTSNNLNNTHKRLSVGTTAGQTLETSPSSMSGYFTPQLNSSGLFEGNSNSNKYHSQLRHSILSTNSSSLQLNDANLRHSAAINAASAHSLRLGEATDPAPDKPKSGDQKGIPSIFLASQSELMESGLSSTTSVTTVPTGSAGDARAPRYRTYRRRWVGLVGLALLNALASWGWLSFAAISAQTADWFGHESESAVNWLSTCILFTYVAAAPVASLVLTKRSVRAAMIVCALLMVAGNWVRYAGTASRHFGVVMLGQVLIGAAQPFALSAATHYTDLWFTSRSRVSANAFISIANPLGGAIAQLVGPAVVSEPGDLSRFVLLTACVASAGSAITAAAPAHPPSPPCASAAAPKLPLAASLRHLLRSWAFLTALSMFAIYVGLFNAYSTFILQIMGPYGYTSDEAGYAGAILIVAGIVSAAVASPVLDRTHHYLALFSLCLPVIAGCYVALIYTATPSRQLAGPLLVSAVLGACSFALLPAILEWVQEQAAPASPAATAAVLWSAGQLAGAAFILSMNALKHAPGDGSNPPENMHRALVFQAAWAGAGVAPLFFLHRIAAPNSRVAMDAAAAAAAAAPGEEEEDSDAAVLGELVVVGEEGAAAGNAGGVDKAACSV